MREFGNRKTRAIESSHVNKLSRGFHMPGDDLSL